MAFQGISTGSGPNLGDGDTLLDGAAKINSNFSEIYNSLGNGTTINAIIEPDGINTGSIAATGLTVTGNTTLGEFESNLVPNTDNNYDLGSISKEWRNLYINGIATVDTLTVDESATIASNLTVNGDTTLGNTNTNKIIVKGRFDTSLVPNSTDKDLGDGSIKWRNLYLSGSATVDTDLTVNGNTTLGNLNTNDTISAIGRFNTNLVPATNLTLDLGTSNYKWGQVYAEGFSGDGANLTSLNADNLTSGTVSASRLGNGTDITSKFLRGDNRWEAIDTSNFVTDNELSSTLSGYVTDGELSGYVTDNELSSTLSGYATDDDLDLYLKKDNGGNVDRLGTLKFGTNNLLQMSSNNTNCNITYKGSGAMIIDGEGSNGIYLRNDQFVTAFFRNNAITLNENTTVGGNLGVTGSKNFKISHPLPEKSETHNLIHSSIEGPQADNIYRGKINLINGTASVNIDTVAKMTEGTFVALNREVQCFTTNETGWTAIKGSVSGNILTITAQDNTCTDTISWLVIGERQDQNIYNSDSTDENGKLIVEIEKIPGEDDPLFGLNLEES